MVRIIAKHPGMGKMPKRRRHRTVGMKINRVTGTKEERMEKRSQQRMGEAPIGARIIALRMKKTA